MASSSLKSTNLLGKRKPEDDLENKPVLRKHKDKEKKSDDNLNSVKDTPGGPLAFIEDVAVRKKTLSAGFFAPMTQTSDIIDFFKDVGQVVHVHILKRLGLPVGHCFLEFASANEAMKALQNKNREYLHGHKILLTKIPDDETEEAAVSTRTLFVANIHSQAQINNVTKFFKDVGKVVRVLLIAGHYGHHLGYGFVEFASANEAMNALQKKKGEYLFNCKIFLEMAPNRPQLPMFCIDHAICCKEDYLQPIKQDETACSFVEEVLLVANISPQITTVERIVDFFEVFGEIVGVRLIVNHEGKHMGYGFVEFASAHVANKALEKKNGKYFHGHKIFLKKGVVKTPDLVEADAVREKTICVFDPPHRIEVSKIIDFFKDVGKVVHVRLFESQEGTDTVYVEFASAYEAKKARKKKKGEYLDGFKINLCVPKLAANPRQPKYEDYLVIEEDAAAVDETPEENDVGKKTLFITKIPARKTMCHLHKIFSLSGDVVRIRLIVDHIGKHVGCGFVEFPSAKEANEAKKVLKKLRHYKFHSYFAEKARHTFRPKYNFEEKLWYQDNIRREGLDYKTIQNLEKLQNPEKEKEISLGFCGAKTTFSDDDEDE